jgi:hypothetical protein
MLSKLQEESTSPFASNAFTVCTVKALKDNSKKGNETPT